MKAYLLAFLIACVASALATPLVRRLAFRVGAVSEPGGRNVNTRSIPRLGGVAIAVAFLLPIVALLPLESVVASTMRTEWRKVLGLIGGALFLSGVGVVDDTKRVAARYKFVLQVVAATAAFAAGFRIDAVEFPIIGTLTMGVFALPVTVVWIVGVVNAVNLIDGLDGLAAGIVFFAGLTNFIVAFVYNDTFVGMFMATTLGAVLGFLFFNFNPARIFMGDSGSYFLGFILGTTSVVGASGKVSTAVSILVPILALGVPIFDTLLSMVRRFIERRPLFSPDRGHIHHRLLDMGITHRRAVLILYGISMVFTVAAVGVSLGRRWHAGLAVLTASVVVLGLVRFLGYFEYLQIVRQQRARVRSPDTEALRRVLPGALIELSSVRADEQVWEALERAVREAQLATAELVPVGKEGAVRVWSGAAEPIDPGELVSTRFPLGDDKAARMCLRFRWRSTTGEVSPSTEVLLQILVDMLASALLRVESQLAPVVAPVPRAPPSRPVPTPAPEATTAASS